MDVQVSIELLSQSVNLLLGNQDKWDREGGWDGMGWDGTSSLCARAAYLLLFGRVIILNLNGSLFLYLKATEDLPDLPEGEERERDRERSSSKHLFLARR